MKGFLRRHGSPEMVALLLLEAALAFMLAYVFAVEARASSLTQAAFAALALGTTSLLLGVYRQRIFMCPRSLVMTTVVGSVLIFPATWATRTMLGIRPSWAGGPGLYGPIAMLLAWVAGSCVLRLGMLLAVRSKLLVRRIALLAPLAEVPGSAAAIQSGRAGFCEAVHAPGMAPAALQAAGIRLALTTAQRFARMRPAERRAYRRAGIDLMSEPVFWERHLRRIGVDHLAGPWHDGSSRQPALIQRVGEVCFSVALLAVTAPLMLLVALLVRLESPGPVLYRQWRVGLRGRPFVLFKFRSMESDAEPRGPAWAQPADPRVTRVGWVIRRLRIDELPQLLNVLRGEMGVIGPRPERPHFVEQLAPAIPYFAERHRVRPGLTGWAQVNYPYGASVEDARAKLSYDLFYVRHRSVMLDLVILAATVRVILFQEGAR